MGIIQSTNRKTILNNLRVVFVEAGHYRSPMFIHTVAKSGANIVGVSDCDVTLAQNRAEGIDCHCYRDYTMESLRRFVSGRRAMIPFDFHLGTVKVLEAAYRSARRKQTVALNG